MCICARSEDDSARLDACVDGLDLAVAIAMSTLNRTFESTKNDLNSATDELESSVASTASRVAQTAREIPGKVIDAVKPGVTFAREHALVVGIAVGALAALGITLYVFSRRD